MNTDATESALQQAKQIITRHNIKDANLFDHKPVLRIRVPDAEFVRVLDMRTKLTEELKSTGFRFIAIDLDDNDE